MVIADRDAARVREILGDAYVWESRVDSWLGGRWLGRVPVAGGSVAWTASQQVQGTLSLTVPRLGSAVEGGPAVDWAPSSPTHPLAPYGQELVVTVRVASTLDGRSYALPAGRFVATQVETGGSTVKVTGKSLLHRVEEDRLTSPTTPRAGGTLASEARRLAAGHVGVLVDPALEDRACPSLSWGESRLDALYEIATAWPARLREDTDGTIVFLPPVTDGESPTLVLSNGEGGTVIGTSATVSREKVYNRVVARSQEQDGAGSPTFQAVADQMEGPLDVRGPYGVVTRFFASPLITNWVQALRSAETMLKDSTSRALKVPVTHAPDPAMHLDELVAVHTHEAAGADHTVRWGRVSATEIPLTASGTARTDIGVTVS